MNKAITVLLVLVGIINFLPVLGVLSAERISAAYAVTASSPDLEILLRHRALLFGVIGGFILVAAFVPAYQPAAMAMAAVSMLGFLWLAWGVGDFNASLRKIAMVDLLGIVFLVAAVALKLVAPGR